MARLLPALLFPLAACAHQPSAEEQAVADALEDVSDTASMGDNVEAVDAQVRDPFANYPVARIDYFPPSLGEPSMRCKYRAGELDPVMDDFERRWYSGQLAAAGEPSLFLESRTRTAGAKRLRFTWLPSFHHSVMVRIDTAPSGEARLLAVRLSGAGGYAPGTPAERVERNLTPEEARKLEAALKQGRLFELPPKICDGGADGAEWIFEAVDAAGYHYLDRWTPRKGPARKIGLLLLSLTGWRFEMIY